MLSLIGQTLGQYQIIEQIGQGGMATVFKAYQPSLDRHIALKVLLHLPAQQPGFAERFQREARIIANLSHPHILPVYDFGQDGAYNFLAMRYVDGAPTLKQAMNEPLALGRAAAFIAQLAQALDAAHQQGVIHRDVKPGNVLLDSDWVLLADFGLARIMESAVELTGTGVGIGTPAYMSPEQGQGLPVDHRTDIYALGIILFEMLTGQIPHDAETPFGIVIKRLTEPLPLPRSINAGIPEAVEHVILKVLARGPDDRFQSAGALAAALGDAINEGAAPAIHPAPAAQPAAATPPAAAASPAAAGSSAANQHQRNRSILLQRVKEFWIRGVLERSLHGMALLELGLETRPQAVDHPWSMVLQTSDLPRLPIPHGTSAADIFNEMQQSLLILGEPGSGKTTMLLELARDLIAQAEQDPARSIPVVFNLASWAQSQPAIEAWLIAELNVRYAIPRRIAADWVRNDSLLLLLDGLDEVAPAGQAACVEALNVFRAEHLAPMAVCSRTADYEALASRLKLQGAVALQALSDQQVDAYLARAGPELDGVRASLQQGPGLRELARSPLMLSMMSLAYRGLPAEALASPGTTAGRLRHLFDTYIQQMFARRGGRQPHPPDQTRHWLSNLAAGMLKHNQTVFMLEQLQPDWLHTRSLRLVYVLASRLAELLFLMLPVMLPFAALLALLIKLRHVDPSRLLNEYAVLAGLLAVAVFLAHSLWISWDEDRLKRSAIARIRPVEHVGWSWQQGVEKTKEKMKAAWRQMPANERRLRQLWLFIWLAVGYPLGFWLLTHGGDGRIVLHPLAAAAVLPIGTLITLLAAIIVNGFISITSKTSVNQGIHLSMRNAIAGGILGPLIWYLVLFGSFWVTTLWSAARPENSLNPIYPFLRTGWFPAGMLVGHYVLLSTPHALTAGGSAVVRHHILRLLLWRSGRLPWGMEEFLDYAAERVFLRKVGGGYIFVHRYLLEHFAGLPAPNRPGI